MSYEEEMISLVCERVYSTVEWCKVYGFIATSEGINPLHPRDSGLVGLVTYLDSGDA